MINPKISIITVTYNAEKVLAKTLDSIRKQEYNNIESIIVDGASNDRTVDIIKEYSDVVTKWISEPDKGLYDAMNKGLDMATGDYVWFLNAGDTITKKDILSYFFNQEFVMRDIYYGDTIIVDENGNKIGGRRLKPKNEISWKSFKWGMLVCHQSVLVKRTIAPRYNLDYKIAADYEWVLESFKRARYIKGTHHFISSFLRGGLSQKNIIRANIERFKIMKQYYGFFIALWYNFLMIFRFLYTVIKLRRI
ncbi:MAG: glycosyltransferase family 2 protein [Bacteroidales bacterium]|nr:glycosyltransferase family 2 protein [Bacilli bacterium]MDD4529311.1 glycosyltransferase family 2 protein [Bacteroidales bacterium]MDD4830002.1 glycosyltransferase family 2 protein [Bacteroidales bacterium]